MNPLGSSSSPPRLPNLAGLGMELSNRLSSKVRSLFTLYHLLNSPSRLWWASGKRSDCLISFAGSGQTFVFWSFAVEALTVILSSLWRSFNSRQDCSRKSKWEYQWSCWIHKCLLTLPRSGVTCLLALGLVTKGCGGKWACDLDATRRIWVCMELVEAFIGSLRLDRSRSSLQVDDSIKTEKTWDVFFSL
jgi:hypothetical protein